jgi:hypothetical protein
MATSFGVCWSCHLKLPWWLKVLELTSEYILLQEIVHGNGYLLYNSMTPSSCPYLSSMICTM